MSKQLRDGAAIQVVSKRPRDVAQRVLCNSRIHELRSLQVEQIEQSLLISGTVKTFYHKQLAQEAIRNVSSGFKVVNQVDVEICDNADTVFW